MKDQTSSELQDNIDWWTKEESRYRKCVAMSKSGSSMKEHCTYEWETAKEALAVYVKEWKRRTIISTDGFTLKEKSLFTEVYEKVDKDGKVTDTMVVNISPDFSKD